MAKIFNRGVRINTNKEEALVVNGSVVVKKDGTLTDNSIKTSHIKDKNVTTGKLADKAVSLGKLAEAVQSAYVIKFVETDLDTTELVGVAEGDIVLRVTATGTTVEPVATADTLPSKPDAADYLIIFRATS